MGCESIEAVMNWLAEVGENQLLVVELLSLGGYPELLRGAAGSVCV